MSGYQNMSVGCGYHDEAIFMARARDLSVPEIAKYLHLHEESVRLRLKSILDIWPEPDDKVKPLRAWEIDPNQVTYASLQNRHW